MRVTEQEVTLGPLDLVPQGEGRNFALGKERIAVFHTRSGELFATQADCPHRNGPLADGLVGDKTVICPLHAWKFDLSTGQLYGSDCKLRTYPVRVTSDGLIALSLGVPESVSSVWVGAGGSWSMP
jgi:nitrite reductase (NADH) small subunit